MSNNNNMVKVKSIYAKDFNWTEDNKIKIKQILSKAQDKDKRSSLLDLLYLAQRQNNNYLTHEAIKSIADILNMEEIKIYEVASFYSMFNLNKVGKYLIQICGTTCCMIKNLDQIIGYLKSELKIDFNQTTEDGLFTLKEVECLGACINAPIIQINDDYIENITLDKIKSILDKLRNNLHIKDYIDRRPQKPKSKDFF